MATSTSSQSTRAASPEYDHVYPSSGANPYGQAWTKHDQLTVSNANVAFAPGSTVSSYQLTESDALVPDRAGCTVLSPGVACWNVITDNGKFLYVTNPCRTTRRRYVDHGLLDRPRWSIRHRRAGRERSRSSPCPLNAIDEALSTNSQYLYVLANQMIPEPGALSTINQYSIDQKTGALTFIGAVSMPRNDTSGLAAW